MWCLLLLTPVLAADSERRAAPAEDPREAWSQVSDLIEHIKAIEQQKLKAGAKSPESLPLNTQPLELAPICYTFLPDGKVQLEYCEMKGSVQLVGQPVEGTVVEAIAKAPEELSKLDPTQVLPCSLARISMNATSATTRYAAAP